MREIKLAKRKLECLQSKMLAMRTKNMREHAPTKENNRAGAGQSDRGEHIGLGEVRSAGIRAATIGESSVCSDGAKCKKCNGDMKKGKAIECKLTGYRDFASDKYPCTVSPDPRQPMLVDCLKCENCGHSITG